MNAISSPVPRLETRYYQPKIWEISSERLPAQSAPSRDNVCVQYRGSAFGSNARRDHGHEGGAGYLVQTSRRDVEFLSIGSRRQQQRETKLPTFIPPKGRRVVESVIVGIIDKARIESYLLWRPNVVERGRVLKTSQVVVVLESRHRRNDQRTGPRQEESVAVGQVSASVPGDLVVMAVQYN